MSVCQIGNIVGDSTLLPICGPDARISTQRNSAWTLSNLCRGKPSPPFNLVAPAIPTLALMMQSKDNEVITDSCWAVSYLTDDRSDDNHQIKAVLAAGIAPRLAELLEFESLTVKTAALRTFGNIASGSDRQLQTLLDEAGSNALLSLSRLLDHPKHAFRQEAAFAISNITAGTRLQIEAVFAARIIPKLVKLMSDREFSVRKEASFCITNALSGGSDEHIAMLVGRGDILQPLMALFKCPDVRLIEEAIDAIAKLVKSGDSSQQRSTIMNQLSTLLKHSSGQIRRRAARLLGDLAAMEPEGEGRKGQAEIPVNAAEGEIQAQSEGEQDEGAEGEAENDQSEEEQEEEDDIELPSEGEEQSD